MNPTSLMRQMSFVGLMNLMTLMVRVDSMTAMARVDSMTVMAQVNWSSCRSSEDLSHDILDLELSQMLTSYLNLEFFSQFSMTGYENRELSSQMMTGHHNFELASQMMTGLCISPTVYMKFLFFSPIKN